jgi:two-component sensor histidine kinase
MRELLVEFGQRVMNLAIAHRNIVGEKAHHALKLS